MVGSAARRSRRQANWAGAGRTPRRDSCGLRAQARTTRLRPPPGARSGRARLRGPGMIGAALAMLPGGYVDQVKRRKRFEAEHPSAQFQCDPPWWRASMIVGGLRREIRRRTELGEALDDLGKLAVIEAQRLHLAEEFTSW